jgi:hypothetical protein
VTPVYHTQNLYKIENSGIVSATKSFEMLRNTLYTLLICGIVLPVFGQETSDTLKTEKSDNESKEPRKAEIRFQADILPAFGGADELSSSFEKPAKLKLSGLLMFPLHEGNVVTTMTYNHTLSHSFDGGVAYTLELKHGSIGPRLGFIAGKQYGVTPGVVAHAGNEAIHFFTQTEFIAELGSGYNNYVFSQVELSYHPKKVHWLSVGIESETRIKFTPIEKERAEFENELLVFAHVHWRQVFIGAGYTFEPAKLGIEKIQTISAVTVSFGVHIDAKVTSKKHH